MIQQLVKKPTPSDDKGDDCPVCSGSGKVGPDKDKDCAACNGTGTAQ